MEFTIQDVKKEHLSAIVEIANSELGNNYLNSILFNDSEGFILRVAIIADSKIVGFCLSSMNEKSVVLKSIAVHSSFQHKGIASSLVNDCIEFSKSQNYSLIMSYAWKNKSRIHLKNILDNFGFIKKQELPEYWKDDSLQKKYTCPSCGEPPCLCTAVVFEKLL